MVHEGSASGIQRTVISLENLKLLFLPPQAVWRQKNELQSQMLGVNTNCFHAEAVDLGPQFPHLQHEDRNSNLQAFREDSINASIVDIYSRRISVTKMGTNNVKLQRITFPDNSARVLLKKFSSKPQVQKAEDHSSSWRETENQSEEAHRRSLVLGNGISDQHVLQIVQADAQMPGTGVEHCLAHRGKQSLGTVLRTWTNSRHVAQESSHMGWKERDQKRLFKAGRHFSWDTQHWGLYHSEMQGEGNRDRQNNNDDDKNNM